MSLTLILVLMTSLISYQAMENAQMRNKLLMRPASVKEFGEFYRFLTSGFVHGSWTHLIINMYVLYIFGEIIEIYMSKGFGDLLGKLLYLLIYLGAITLSSLPSYIKHQNNQYYSALGASGGTSAIIFIFIFFGPWHILYLFFILPIPAVIAGVLYLAYSSYMSKNGNDNIGHDAHFWGAVFGFVAIVLLSFIFNSALITRFMDLLMAGPSF